MLASKQKYVFMRFCEETPLPDSTLFDAIRRYQAGGEISDALQRYLISP